MSLEVSNLSKIYGAQRAVDAISFSASEGEILGFLGPNGAGKSTTMKMATCYIPPTEGTIKVCGYDVVADPITVRENVGYLPEHNPLYLDLYVHEYLEFVGSLHKISGKKLRDRVQEMVELVGLTREQKKKIGALSKGYRQRVGLAQALIHDPKVLILDEPTTGLDPNQIVEIRNVIKAISANKTVVFSTHIMQEVQALCDRIVIINLGKIVANSSVQGLKENKGEVKITVEFDFPIAKEELAKKFELEFIEEISSQKFRLSPKDGKDIRKDLFQFAAGIQNPLLSLHKEEVTLESIFQSLTKKQENNEFVRYS